MCTRPRARNWSRWKDERHDIADLRIPQRRAGRRADAGVAGLPRPGPPACGSRQRPVAAGHLATGRGSCAGEADHRPDGRHDGGGKGRPAAGRHCQPHPDDVRRYRLGSILAGGNSDPGGRIPLLFGIDAVHGQSNIIGATLFPHNIGLGATRNRSCCGRSVASPRWKPASPAWSGRSHRPLRYPRMIAGAAATRATRNRPWWWPAMPRHGGGIAGQGGTPEFLDGRHVIASVKHFLGDGGTTDGRTRATPASVSRTWCASTPPDTRRPSPPSAQTAMASFNSVNGEKMHGHRHYLTDVLKDA